MPNPWRTQEMNELANAAVTMALKDRILPNLPKIPTKVLTDNGSEFRCGQFNEALSSFGIRHIYSTPYKPSSNGLVERSNRTTIQLLKGLIRENVEAWDTKIHKVVLV